MRNKARKAAGILTVVFLLLTAAIIYTHGVMARKDAMHDRFLATGREAIRFLSSYSKALTGGFRMKEGSNVASFYSESYSVRGRGDWVFEQEPAQAGVSVFRLKPVGHRDYSKADRQAEVVRYLTSIKSIDHVELKINLIENVDFDRAVVLTVKFVLDGTDAGDRLFEDRFFYRWHLANEGTKSEHDWKIVKDELVEGVRVAGDGHAFLDVDPETIGIDYKHQRDPKLDVKSPSAHSAFIMGHAFGGVSTVDYNNDGRPDIFFADGRRSRLYRNDGITPSGQIRFTDVTHEAGLDGIDQATAGIFADVDNDGFPDLLVLRYLAPNKLFHNNGDGTFTDRSAEMGLDFIGTSTSACFLDYDRDGYVDLYVAQYGDAFHDSPRLPFFAQNAKPNRLFHNERGRRFKDVTEQSGTGDTGWSLAVACDDYDGDGFPDIAVANDFGRKNLYHNNHDGSFTEMAKHAGVLDFGGGMGVAFADVDDDGYLDLYTSNVNTNQRWYGEEVTINQYIRNVSRTKWAFLDAGEYWKLYQLLGPQWVKLGRQVGEGNSLFHNNGNGTFTKLEESQTNRAGWSWGVVFFDMDNSTKLDIYAANGWISNAPNTDL